MMCTLLKRKKKLNLTGGAVLFEASTENRQKKPCDY